MIKYKEEFEGINGNIGESVDEKKDASDTCAKSLIDIYLQELERYRRLEENEEIALIHRFKKGDEAAKKTLIESHLRLVVKIAKAYSHLGIPLLDLISEGNMGLMKAVERFNPDKGAKLSTYAVYWIKQYIIRAISYQSRTIRLPIHVINAVAKLRKLTLDFNEKSGRDPKDDELSKLIGLPVNKIEQLRKLNVRPLSLNAPVNNEEDTDLSEMIADENSSDPIDKLTCNSNRAEVKKIVAKLNKREAKIISLRYGFNNEKPKSFIEIGEDLKISPNRVRQIENYALQRMRESLRFRIKSFRITEIND